MPSDGERKLAPESVAESATKSERRRGMRGLIRRVRAGAQVIDRRLVATGQDFPWHVYKVCTWCGGAVDEPRKRYWHTHCHVWHSASKNQLSPYAAYIGHLMPLFGAPGWNAYWREWKAFKRCVECGVHEDALDRKAGDKLEIEHELAISIAVELGPRAVMRAFMPDNLRFLCRKRCHAAKTKRDRVLLKILRKGIYPKTPVALPSLPMFS